MTKRFLPLLLLGLIGVPAKAAPIQWDSASLTLVAGHGGYGRMIELPGGDLLAGYSADRAVWARRSGDGGKTWDEPVRVAAWDRGHLTNSELLALKDGRIFYFFNGRPDSAFGETVNGKRQLRPGTRPDPFTIGLAQSRDGGRTWDAPRTLYSAGPEFFNGCWEPAAVQLPDGEMQLFFANEGPYRKSDEQEITLLRSRDGGRSWEKPRRVSFRAGFRDGMPVPLVLAGNAGLVLAIEDNGLSGGQFKPAIVASGVRPSWNFSAIDGRSPRRWGALARPLPPDTYAGAPYVRQLPTGETVLSFQQRAAGEARERIVVCVGDARAKNFDSPTFPFPATPDHDQQWAGLCARRDGSVIVLANATINGARGVWSVRGKLAR